MELQDVKQVTFLVLKMAYRQTAADTMNNVTPVQ